MKQTLNLFFLLISLLAFGSSTTKEELKSINGLIENNIDTALILSKRILERSYTNDDSYGIVKGNLFLGYIHEKQQDYVKAVLYYLEGIRQADKLSYENIERDKIQIRKNLANVFRQFEANRLATKYNLEAIDLAINHDFSNYIIDLKYNQALVYQKNKQYHESSQFMLEILPMIEHEGYKSEIINQIGLVYLESKEYQKAEEYFNQLINIPYEVRLFKAKALHNLGEINYETGNIDKSIDHLRQSIKIMTSIEGVDNYSIFLSFRNIGRYLFEVGNVDEAEEFLIKAEQIAEYAEWDASSFEIYKTLSSLNYSIGNDNLGKEYSDLYFSKIQDYLKTQDDLQKKEKEINFDLVAKTYHDEIAQQERIADILFYSKLISFSLLTLLILVVAFNRYQKVRLRKSILEDLLELKIVE
ncbi:tetratricopeptide repeat protein [Ekhidna sp.]